MGRKFTLYHSTPSENVPSILEKGIVPRSEKYCESLIDTILKEFTWTRESLGKRRKWMWQHPLHSCLMTEGKVYVSGDKQYSMQSCRAGLEAEHQLRQNLGYLASKYKKKPREIPVSRPQCFVCTIEVDEDKSFTGEDPEWHKNIAEQVKSLRERYAEMGSDWPGDEEIIKEQLELRYDNISPDEIVKCELVKGLEDATKKIMV